MRSAVQNEIIIVILSVYCIAYSRCKIYIIKSVTINICDKMAEDSEDKSKR